MLLFEIRELIKSKKNISMHELSVHFKKDHEVLRPLLENWINKGVVKKVVFENLCCNDFKGCGNCVKLIFEVYEYCGK
jgi:putative ferrous iron transport protein C